MTFRYSTSWIFMDLVGALAMAVALYIGLHPEWWGWALFAPLFLYMALETARKYMYSVTVDGERILVVAFRPAQYLVSDIVEVDVYNAKGGRMGVVRFTDRSKFSFSGRLAGFDELIKLLKSKASPPEPVQAS